MAKKAKAPATRYSHIMIDMETLGLTADSVILSIGAVKFNTTGPISDDAFYAVCDIDSQRDRHINAGTLAWWIGQTDKAKEVFNAPDKHTLVDALSALAEWVDHPDYFVWSNGADFDIPILAHAQRMNGMPPLFKHWNHRCFRTLKGMDQYANSKKPPFTGTAHNALMDAYHQAQWAQALLAK